YQLIVFKIYECYNLNEVYMNKDNKIFRFYLKHEEMINYLIAGGLTTFISIFSYYLLRFIINDYYINTALSWIIAVTFAFIVNKVYVFKSKNENKLLEYIKFIGSRIATLLIELLLMFIFVKLLKINDMIVKIFIQVIVIVLNYILSKLYVFKKEN
ncbi:MAG: GtrA family protein, partial [Bacilli bacterium]|nr:GtrA family protein [Bacilli bacterium]